MQVYPLTISQINWPVFLKQAKEHLGRGITRHIDDQNQDSKCPMAFLSALQNFQDPDFKSFRVYDIDRCLDHMFFGFLIVEPPVGLWMGLRDFLISDNEKMIVVSGTLNSWILYTRSLRADPELCRQIKELFGLMGLKVLFENRNQIK